MGRYSRIFAQDKEEQEDIQPMYEHLDGTVEVLGFEQYRISSESFESTTNEIEERADSLEADIVLLETISQQQRDTNRQDTGVSAPNYQGLEIDEQKISLSDDSKKVFIEKGIDYRKVVSSEGLIDKVKEIWEWIVEKIKSWWDKLWGDGKSSSSGEKSKENKEAVKELKEAKQNGIDPEKATQQVAKQIKDFDFNKWGSFLFTNEDAFTVKTIVKDLFDVEKNAERHLTASKNFNELLSKVTQLIKNQLLPIGEGLVASNITEEDAKSKFEEYHTHLKDALKSVMVKDDEYDDGQIEMIGFSHSNWLRFEEKEQGAYEIRTHKQDRVKNDEKLEAQDLYDEAIKFIEQIGKETFVKKFEDFVKTAEELVVIAQKSRDHYVLVGKELDEVNKKIEKGLKDPKDFYPTIQTQFGRAMTDIMKITAFMKNEIVLLEEFTAAFINICRGYIGEGTKAGGAIVEPHANWEVKK